MRKRYSIEIYSIEQRDNGFLKPTTKKRVKTLEHFTQRQINELAYKLVQMDVDAIDLIKMEVVRK